MPDLTPIRWKSELGKTRWQPAINGQGVYKKHGIAVTYYTIGRISEDYCPVLLPYKWAARLYPYFLEERTYYRD